MKKKKILILLGLKLILLMGISNASAAGGYLAKGSTLIAVANIWGSEDDFIVTATGGTGSCLDQKIIFKRSTALNDAIHNRAYATALTAFSSGAKVNIYSGSGLCDGAGHIQLKK